MKIWYSYGSEHSMNLVMIGSFKQVADAEEAKRLIDELAEQVRKEPMRSYDDDPNEARFSKEMLIFLRILTCIALARQNLNNLTMMFTLNRRRIH